MRRYLKHLILGGVGGLLYVVLELAWRGHSHWTMFVLGGVCFVFIGAVNEVISWCIPIWQQSLIGTAIITIMEFLTGCVVNLWLNWGVWDYSNLPCNVFGQICLPYMLLWVPVALVAILLDDWLRFWMFREARPHYCFWRHRKNVH